MSEAEQFRQYAEEAMRWVRLAGNERDRLALIKLARTWQLAADQAERIMAIKESPAPERRVA